MISMATLRVYVDSVDAIPRAAPGCVHACSGADVALHALGYLRTVRVVVRAEAEYDHEDGPYPVNDHHAE